MQSTIVAAALCAVSFAAIARAETPGVADKVYAARLDPDVTEFEARAGRLTGGDDHGETGLVLEVAHVFGRHVYLGIELELEREAHESLRAEEAAIEAVVALGRIPGIGVDIGVYGELGAPLHGEPVAVTSRLLLEKSAGPLDARVNLRAERTTGADDRFTFGYAASADVGVIEDVRLGLAAFGDLGDTRRFGGRQAHVVGPVAKFELEHLPGGGELEVETGYLFALGKAREDSFGQARLQLEWAARF